MTPEFLPADLARFESILNDSLLNDPAAASNSMTELVRAGGKRIRPALVLLSAQLGDYDFERTAPAAIAVELTHAATLVHDDVIDRADLRRGRPTVRARTGDPAAIVVGDFYFAKAYREAGRTGSSQVVEILAAAIMRVCHGELQQQASRYHYRVSRDGYLRRIELKTGALIAAACRIGAVLGGLDSASQISLSRYGRLLGLAFQVADDVLDYTGSEGELGKPVGKDLLEGHVTLPLMLALSGPGGDQIRAQLEDGRQLAEVEVAGIVDAVRASGGPAEALRQAREWAAEAKWELQPFASVPAATRLSALADYVVSRNL